MLRSKFFQIHSDGLAASVCIMQYKWDGLQHNPPPPPATMKNDKQQRMYQLYIFNSNISPWSPTTTSFMFSAVNVTLFKRQAVPLLFAAK